MIDKKVAVAGGSMLLGSLAAYFTLRKKSPIPTSKTTTSAASLAAANAVANPIGATSGYPKTAKVTTSSSSLNVRATPETSGSVVTTVAKGGTVTINDAPVLGDATQSSGWAPITVNGKKGYASMEYLTVTS